MFEVPGIVRDLPAPPTFRISGNKAIVTFNATYVADEVDEYADPEEIQYVTRTVTTVLAFSGDSDNTQLQATYTKE